MNMNGVNRLSVFNNFLKLVLLLGIFTRNNFAANYSSLNDYECV